MFDPRDTMNANDSGRDQSQQPDYQTASYTYGASNGSAQPFMQDQQDSPKKKSGRLKWAALGCAGVIAVSFCSIQLYKMVGSNETLSTLFLSSEADSETDSEESTNPTLGTQESVSGNDPDRQYEAGQSWIQLAAREDALSIPEAVQKAMPSAVGIAATFTWEEQYSGFGGFFGYGGDQSYEQSATATGTGIIMSKDGYIITNAHVVYDAEYGGKATELTVVLADETEYEATLTGYDSESDLAVLKINASDLPAAEFGDSDELMVGELVIAIGNPLGFELFGSVTCGIVSALNREITINENNMTLIQTDAAINAGNSGGPLVNSYGQVIGINSAKMTSSYSSASVEGLGFAIPINDASAIIDDLINYGYVRGKPQIGIIARDVSDTVSEAYGIPVGVYVYAVTEGGAAEQAGIQQGDVIIAANGKTVTTYDELNQEKNAFQAGDTLSLTITRNGQDYDVDVVLQEKMPDDGNLYNED